MFPKLITSFRLDMASRVVTRICPERMMKLTVARNSLAENEVERILRSINTEEAKKRCYENFREMNLYFTFNDQLIRHVDNGMLKNVEIDIGKYRGAKIKEYKELGMIALFPTIVFGLLGVIIYHP